MSRFPIPFLAIFLALASTAALAQSATPVAPQGGSGWQQHQGGHGQGDQFGPRQGGHGDQNFAEHKRRHLEMIAQRIEILHHSEGCVRAAASPQDLRQCAEAQRGAMGALRRQAGSGQNGPGD